MPVTHPTLLCGDVELNPGPMDQSESARCESRSSEALLSTDAGNTTPLLIQSGLADHDNSTQPILHPGNVTFAHSLVPKWNGVSDFLVTAPCSRILGLSESWLNASVTDTALSVDNYCFYRKDRQGRRGGGILVYVPDEIRSWRRNDLEHNSIEAIWLELRTNQSLIHQFKSQTLIDHCYISSPCLLMTTSVAALAGSDHQLILLTQESVTKVKSPTPKHREVRSFRKCNMNR